MRDNIKDRRAYIKGLLESGAEVNAKEIARMFNSSFPAVMNDISIVESGFPHYRKSNATQQNTRSRKLGADGIITDEDWQGVLIKYNHSCAYCGGKKNLSLDHIKPLSKGGTNTKDNIQPLCKSCNSSKGNR